MGRHCEGEAVGRTARYRIAVALVFHEQPPRSTACEANGGAQRGEQSCRLAIALARIVVVDHTAAGIEAEAVTEIRLEDQHRLAQLQARVDLVRRITLCHWEVDALDVGEPSRTQARVAQTQADALL